MAASVSIQVSDRKVIDAVSRARRALSDTKPMMEDIAESMLQKVQLLFVDSENPFGHPWKPLKFRKGQPLRDTSQHLLGSMTYKATKDEAEIGTTFKYAHVHQLGAIIKPVRAKRLVFTPRGFSHPIFAKQVEIPARPFLPEGELPAEWRQTVLLTITSYLKRESKGALSAG